MCFRVEQEMSFANKSNHTLRRNIIILCLTHIRVKYNKFYTEFVFRIFFAIHAHTSHTTDCATEAN